VQLRPIASAPAAATSAPRIKQADGDIDAPRERSSLSDPAQLFKKLEALAKADPVKFKETTAALAKKVEEAAAAATDPREKQMLSELGKKFSDASRTGDASGLKPPEGSAPRGPPPGGKPPPRGGGGVSKVLDPADTNQDGTVSEKERAAYEAKTSKAVSAYARSARDGREVKAQAVFASLSAIVASAS
jgi:hypothetical protein